MERGLPGIGESSLDYEVVYVVRGANYQLHMDLQQSVILKLMRELDRIGARFAFASRSIVLARDAAVHRQP